MAAPVVLRADFDGLQLRMLAKQTKDAAFARRMLALAEIYDGGLRGMQPASAVSACRPFAIGSFASTPRVPTA